MILDKQLTEPELDDLFAWVDTLPLSRAKKYPFYSTLRNINRDYSDALLMAETINNFYPKYIDLHNYPATNSVKSKLANWKTLNSMISWLWFR